MVHRNICRKVEGEKGSMNLDALVNAHDQVSVTPTHENRALSTQLGGEGKGEGGCIFTAKSPVHPSIPQGERMI